MYINIIKWWLAGLLLFLPFQHKIVKILEFWSIELSILVNRLDELTIIILFPLSIIEFYKNRKSMDSVYVILFLSVLAFFCSGVISGIINNNLLLITGHGSFNYLKNILVIFIFIAFIRDIGIYKKIVNYLLMVMIFFGIISVIQEITAIGYRHYYISDLSNTVETIIHALNMNIDLLKSDNYSWRFGIFRTPSFMIHANVLGIYCLLILTIYSFSEDKLNWRVLLVFLSVILFSVSRMVYTGFLIITVGWLVMNRRWVAIAVSVTVVAAIGIIFFHLGQNPDDLYSVSFRGYGRYKAFEIWKDHPLLGVGPGMFGDSLSFKYYSHIYSEYNFTARQSLEYIQGIDQFWPQLLAETGIIGFISYIGVLISLFIIFTGTGLREANNERKGLFIGLALFTVVLLCYGFGIDININPVLFTYSAFVGMSLSCMRKCKSW